MKNRTAYLLVASLCVVILGGAGLLASVIGSYLSHHTGKSSAAPAAPNYELNNVRLSSIKTGQVFCAGLLNLYRLPGGQEYTDASVESGYMVTQGEHCADVPITRNQSGQLLYHQAEPYEFNVWPTQPLVLDTSREATADMFLTQDLSRELSPGQVRYVDTAAIETDPHGLHLLAGFPTAAKRFYAYYASVSVAGGKVSVCLPAGSNNNQGQHGGGDDHAATYVRVHALQNCSLPTVVKPSNYPGPASNIPLHHEGFGECSDLIQGPDHQYFAYGKDYWRDAGMPGYSRWPLHVKITHSSPATFKAVVIDPQSCGGFENTIIPIHSAAR